MSGSTYDQVPEDSVLRRHFETTRRMERQAGASPRAAVPPSESAHTPGLLERLLRRLFG